MEYVFTHICVPATDTTKRSGMLFARYVKDDEPVQATCPGCGELTTDAIDFRGNKPGVKDVEYSNITLIPDIQPFRSPVDGSVVGSRSALTEHNKRNNVVQLGNDRIRREEQAVMPRAGHDIKRALDTARG